MLQIFKESELMPILQKEASNKKLKIFTFRGAELSKYYNTKYDNVAAVLLAKNEENAI